MENASSISKSPIFFAARPVVAPKALPRVQRGRVRKGAEGAEGAGRAEDADAEGEEGEDQGCELSISWGSPS
eukprot:scaffold27541_cov56-Phaeocystis_antarctica.AAC.3